MSMTRSGIRLILALALSLPLSLIGACAGKQTRESSPETAATKTNTSPRIDKKYSEGPIPAEIEAFCADHACREDTPQRVQVDQDRYWEGVYPRSAYVPAPGMVVILPGESIELSADTDDRGKLTNLKVVPANGNLQISASLMESSTLLTIRSTYERPLAYCAFINIPGTGRVKTSTVGVGAGIQATEMWEDPIIELVLTDLRLTDEQEECR